MAAAPEPERETILLKKLHYIKLSLGNSLNIYM